MLPSIFDDADDVVERADDMPFGLAGPVCDPNRDAAIIHGVIIPFGEHEQAGMGVEDAVEGLNEFTNTRMMMFRT